MEFRVYKLPLPDKTNVIVGQAHFIKTVEDLYEILVGSAPGIKFGVAFCEASGACLVRSEGNDSELRKLATQTAFDIGAGHTFVIYMKGAYPINVLKAVQSCPEVCGIFCATANPVEVIVAEGEQGRGLIGIIDGLKPKGIEDEQAINWRKDFLRKIGYKR